MTAYELAEKLLKGPNLPVYTFDADAWKPVPLVNVELSYPIEFERADRCNPTLPDIFIFLAGKE